MSRLTRSKSQVSSAVKENIAVNQVKSDQKPVARKHKNQVEIDSSPPKISRSSTDLSLSPLENQLCLVNLNDNKFRSARRALVDNSENRLPGRESEVAELTNYIKDIIKNKSSGSLYISGAPGTGKTATLLKIINEIETKLKIVFINCTSITSAGAIYKKICNELDLKIGGGSEKDCLATLERYFVSTKRKVTLLIVLDEIDQLSSMTKKHNILYSIFEWPSLPNSKLILVGIANSLDLTDRLLIRLQTKCELKPKVMNFTAYTKNQIIEIFKSRLEEGGVSELFPPAAIQLLAAKVSAVSGDIRRALNIGKRVVELAVLEKKKKGKKIDITKFEELITSEGAEIEEPEADKKIELKEVVTVLNSVYGNAQKFGNDMDEGFPLQQKILICTLLLLIKYDKNKHITVGRLHNVYKKICCNRNINAIDLSEFLNLCVLVETRGIMRILKKKEPRFHIVQLVWDEDEVCAGLKDKQMIENILSEKSLLV